ncbi:MAG: hypothetical protein CVV41_15795 [Candidatus Riflebacteria bacterium HGW-Riflebacteria-1]|jgi:nucleoside-triphosphatase THEP1|nr:MAG: hypothetical protein CVV41_15795 [Candidatus Riflebacteria bacterium HGW-Riflebacteria-1]
MIYIVCGEINAGKTSWMADDYRQQKAADGFVCKKVFADAQHIGYDLEHLSTGERCRFIRKPGFLPEDWNEVAFLAERYSFCSEGFVFADKIADAAMANGCNRFYIDEIGPLELMQQGFHDLLVRLLRNQQSDLVIAVRSCLVDDVKKLFNLGEATQINIV